MRRNRGRGAEILVRGEACATRGKKNQAPVRDKHGSASSNATEGKDAPFRKNAPCSHSKKHFRPDVHWYSEAKIGKGEGQELDVEKRKEASAGGEKGATSNQRKGRGGLSIGKKGGVLSLVKGLDPVCTRNKIPYTSLQNKETKVRCSRRRGKTTSEKKAAYARGLTTQHSRRRK